MLSRLTLRHICGQPWIADGVLMHWKKVLTFFIFTNDLNDISRLGKIFITVKTLKIGHERWGNTTLKSWVLDGRRLHFRPAGGLAGKNVKRKEWIQGSESAAAVVRVRCSSTSWDLLQHQEDVYSHSFRLSQEPCFWRRLEAKEGKKRGGDHRVSR